MTNQSKDFKIVLVGGNWESGHTSKPSSYVAKLAAALFVAGADDVLIYNSGKFEDLEPLLAGDTFANCDAIIWMANVPDNTLPKVRNVKERWPHKLLVTTKRNNGEYSFQSLINHALGLKANLCIDFAKKEEKFLGRVYDPLAVCWLDHTADIQMIANVVVARLRQLREFTRQGTRPASAEPLLVPQKDEFFGLVRDYAEVLHSLVVPEKAVTRFLGNSSFRCARGFPSLRDTKSGNIFVSRRNVDKRFIDASAFVGVAFDGKDVLYWGPQKPSVDTPIQVRLYEALPNVHFMLHAHVYLRDAPTTREAIPCGALEEVEEILRLIPDRSTGFTCLNLLGHGCLVLSDDPKKMKDLPLITRPVPEYLQLS